MSREKKHSLKLEHTVAKPTVEDIFPSRKQAIRVSTDFLKLDLATALTFTGIAFSTQNPQLKERNRRSARRAYDTVVHLRGKIEVSESDAEILKEGLRRLRSELRKLGEKF